MVQRLTYRRRHCYATKSNKLKKVKTPGARLPQACGTVGAQAAVGTTSQPHASALALRAGASLTDRQPALLYRLVAA